MQSILPLRETMDLGPQHAPPNHSTPLPSSLPLTTTCVTLWNKNGPTSNPSQTPNHTPNFGNTNGPNMGPAPAYLSMNIFLPP